MGRESREVAVMNLERIQVVCPACGQQVEAVAVNGRVKGYCAIARQYVDFPVENRDAVETKAEVAAELVPKGEGRDSQGRFVRGNVPWNRKNQSAETKATISAKPALLRDSRGRFIKKEQRPSGG